MGLTGELSAVVLPGYWLYDIENPGSLCWLITVKETSGTSTGNGMIRCNYCKMTKTGNYWNCSGHDIVSFSFIYLSPSEVSLYNTVNVVIMMAVIYRGIFFISNWIIGWSVNGYIIPYFNWTIGQPVKKSTLC